MFRSYLPPTNFAKTFFCNSTWDKDFLARAITSHLQTHGCTVVTGNHKEKINMFIHSLSLFLTPAERKLSSVVSEGDRSYVPDLYLQGILKTSIKDEITIQSRLPTTIIDIDNRTVKQTHTYQYASFRNEYLHAQVEKLVNSNNNPTNNTNNPTTKAKDQAWSTEQEGLFRVVKESAQCIQHIIVEMYKLPHALRETYLVQSLRVLTRKAVVLIKYVQVELYKAKIIPTSTIKKLRTDLQLTVDGDYAVLLGLAEKLSPGIYADLAGDPASIEERFIELFESF